jgi:hypothetical protein
MKPLRDRSHGRRGRPVVLRGARDDKRPSVARKVPPPADGAACVECRVVFWHKTWRRSRGRLMRTYLRGTPFTTCPACRQVDRGEYFGRVVLRGASVQALEAEIRRRIRNVASRARFTQPERRVVAVRRRGAELEVRTTSQKLAHRIARELEKAFRGRAHYAWSDREGRLDAVWESD